MIIKLVLVPMLMIGCAFMVGLKGTLARAAVLLASPLQQCVIRPRPSRRPRKSREQRPPQLCRCPPLQSRPQAQLPRRLPLQLQAQVRPLLLALRPPVLP